MTQDCSQKLWKQYPCEELSVVFSERVCDHERLVDDAVADFNPRIRTSRDRLGADVFPSTTLVPPRLGWCSSDTFFRARKRLGFFERMATNYHSPL